MLLFTPTILFTPTLLFTPTPTQVGEYSLHVLMQPNHVPLLGSPVRRMASDDV